MSCDTKLNTLNFFKKEGLLSDTRQILDRTKFDEANEKYTKVAQDVHGLDTGGKLIFDIETSERTIDRGDIVYARKEQIYRAVPVDEFFKVLDDLVVKNDILEDEALRTINNRTPVMKTVNVGEKYTDDPVQHFTSGTAYKSNLNKRAKVSNEGFINQSEDKVFFQKLVDEYYTRSGRKYNINNKSSEGKRIQMGFYEFLNKKGIKGVEVFDSNNDLHMVKFNFGQQMEFADNTMDESMQTNLFAEGVVPTEQQVNKSQLEDLNWYNEKDLNTLYERYTPTQINRFLSEDMANAQEVFNEYLYGNEFNNTNYVSDREVNDQIKKCK
jgi:hypothetical protein